MSSVVGGLVDPILGTDISGQKAERKAQDAALNAQMEAADKQLAANQLYTDKQIQMLTDQSNKSLALQQQAFDYYKAQQDYMNSITRPSLTAAADYYNNLTTNNYIAQGATALEQAYAQADSRTTQQLATRGISDSGIAANMIMSLNNNLAQSKAALVAGAPGEVAKQRAAFAGQTQPYVSQYDTMLQNSTANMANTYSNFGTNAANVYNQSGANTMNIYGAMGNASASFNLMKASSIMDNRRSIDNTLMKGAGMGVSYAGAQYGQTGTSWLSSLFA